MKPLSVIKAPAGFGKTCLAVAWADQLLRSGNSVAWFSIDANDNELTQLVSASFVAHSLSSPSIERTASARFSPKKRGPDQWAPVVAW
jgi:LuxR family transcriptional regulator, maltose regulon positive regulatory protein